MVRLWKSMTLKKAVEPQITISNARQVWRLRNGSRSPAVPGNDLVQILTDLAATTVHAFYGVKVE